MSYQCQSYVELSSPDELAKYVINDPPNWLVQLKYDGIWALVKIQNNEAVIYSKTGQVKRKLPVQNDLLSRQPCVLVGEFMFGSQWSTHPERAGKLYIFDCLQVEGLDISKQAYKHRYRVALSVCIELGQPFNAVPCYSISRLGQFWLTLSDKTEGFIVRTWSAPWDETLFKLKYEVEDDFVILGAEPGKGKHEGRLGALKVGQFDVEKSDLVYVMDVGGGFTDQERELFWKIQDELRNQVVLVRGKGRFSSGALRHPEFVRLRDDKIWTQCLLKKSSK